MLSSIKRDVLMIWFTVLGCYAKVNDASTLEIYPYTDTFSHPGPSLTYSCSAVLDNPGQTNRIEWAINNGPVPVLWNITQERLSKNILKSILTVSTVHYPYDSYIMIDCMIPGTNLHNGTSLTVEDPVCKMKPECILSLTHHHNVLYCRWKSVEANCSCQKYCFYEAWYHQTYPMIDREPLLCYGDYPHFEEVVEPWCQHVYQHVHLGNHYGINMSLTVKNSFSSATHNHLLSPKVMPGEETKILKVSNVSFELNSRDNDKGVKVDIEPPTNSALCKYNGFVEYQILDNFMYIDEDNKRHNEYIKNFWQRYQNYSIDIEKIKDTSDLWKDSKLTRNMLYSVTIPSLPPNTFILLRAGIEPHNDSYSDHVTCYHKPFMSPAQVVKTGMFKPLPVKNILLIQYPEKYKVSFPQCAGESNDAVQAIIAWEDSEPRSATNVVNAYNVGIVSADGTTVMGRSIASSTHCVVIPKSVTVGEAIKVNITAENEVGRTNRTKILEIDNSRCTAEIVSSEIVGLVGRVVTLNVTWTQRDASCNVNISNYHLSLVYWKERNNMSYSNERLTKKPVYSFKVQLEIIESKLVGNYPRIYQRNMSDPGTMPMYLQEGHPYRMSVSLSKNHISGAKMQSKSILTNTVLFRGIKAPSSGPQNPSLLTKEHKISIEWDFPLLADVHSAIDEFTIYYSTAKPCSNPTQVVGNCRIQLKRSQCSNTKIHKISHLVSGSLKNNYTGAVVTAQELRKDSFRHTLAINKSETSYYVWISAVNAGGESPCSIQSHVTIKRGNMMIGFALTVVSVIILVTVGCLIAAFKAKKAMKKIKVPKPHITAKITMNQIERHPTRNDEETENQEDVEQMMLPISTNGKQLNDEAFIKEDINENRVFVKSDTEHDESYIKYSATTDSLPHRFSNLSYISGEEQRYHYASGNEAAMDSGVWSSRPSRSVSSGAQNRLSDASSQDYVEDVF